MKICAAIRQPAAFTKEYVAVEIALCVAATVANHLNEENDKKYVRYSPPKHFRWRDRVTGEENSFASLGQVLHCLTNLPSSLSSSLPESYFPPLSPLLFNAVMGEFSHVTSGPSSDPSSLTKFICSSLEKKSFEWTVAALLFLLNLLFPLCRSILCTSASCPEMDISSQNIYRWKDYSNPNSPSLVLSAQDYIILTVEWIASQVCLSFFSPQIVIFFLS
jgi:hypothetical protein